MDTQKTQITERLGQATNILVTVSVNPSVDQLSAAIGLTLLLNKMGKHATAVFSGKVPSTMEFLQPEKTLEKNTDSLRDFIIALDKSKADKLRYKVEDQMVKIFITPYRVSISDKDLEFSQGDFNVEVVIAVGVNQQSELDEAITSHGRILHDATVIGINTQEGASLGSINWAAPGASSLCEMLVELGLELKPDALDAQMATAFLTGIVAETDRFSNEKTSSQTMQMSAKLMAAGANQQLVASQLQPSGKEAVSVTETPEEVEADFPEPNHDNTDSDVASGKPPQASDGSLLIDHEEATSPKDEGADIKDEPAEEALTLPAPEEIHIDETGQLKSLNQSEAPREDKPEEPKKEADQASIDDTQKPDEPEPLPGESAGSRLVLQPPLLGGKLTANSVPEALDPSTDPLGTPLSQAPLLRHDASSSDYQSPLQPPNLDPVPPMPSIDDLIGSTSSSDAELASLPDPLESQPSPDTLADLEKVVDSPHLDQSLPDLSIPDPVVELPDPTPQPLVSVPETASVDNDNTPKDLNDARDAVQQAMSGTPPQILEPVQSLNAQPMDLNLGDMPAVNTSPASAFADFHVTPAPVPVPNPITSFDPTSLVTPVNTDPNPLPVAPVTSPDDSTITAVQDSNAPPPVPPPMMPPIMTPVVPPPDDSNGSSIS